jgi:hypothetical protein
LEGRVIAEQESDEYGRAAQNTLRPVRSRDTLPLTEQHSKNPEERPTAPRTHLIQREMVQCQRRIDVKSSSNRPKFVTKTDKISMFDVESTFHFSLGFPHHRLQLSHEQDNKQHQPN